MKVYVNGQYYPKEEARISVFDHGLLYGDGVFEGIRVYQNRIFKLEEHIDRLYESAQTIMLSIPMSKKEMIAATVDAVCENPYEDAYIRLVVTRGVGSLGLDPNKCHKPQVIIIVDKITLYSEDTYKDGMQIVTVPTRRNLNEALSARVKSLNYLNNIMGKIEAINAGCQEAIMMNQEGFIAECTGDNVFIVKKNKLITPSLECGVLEGITRDTVMELGHLINLEVMEDILTRHDLFNADECFLTGTAAEIVPVVKIDGRKIGGGKPGQMTLELIKKYNQLTLTEGYVVPRKVKV